MNNILTFNTVVGLGTFGTWCILFRASGLLKSHDAQLLHYNYKFSTGEIQDVR